MPRASGRVIGTDRRLPTEFDALVRLYPPRAIHDEVEYANAQEVIDRLTSLPEPTEGQAEYLETLSILFEAYEYEHHAIDPAVAGPVEMLRFLMEQRGESAAEVDGAVGGRAAQDFLAGRRELRVAEVRALADHFHVRADLFL